MKATAGICLLSGLLIGGCVPSKDTTFYWGDYSQTLYDFTKDPTEETLAAHKEQLLLIIKESPNRGKRVPPGVYAEYGYILLKEGKEKEGLGYLNMEMGIYPEALIFITRIKDEYARGKK